MHHRTSRFALVAGSWVPTTPSLARLAPPRTLPRWVGAAPRSAQNSTEQLWRVLQLLLAAAAPKPLFLPFKRRAW